MVGERLRALRNSRNLRQEDIARVVGVTPEAIGLYEANKREPKGEILLKLAEIFDVSVDYLMGRDNPVNLREALLSDSPVRYGRRTLGPKQKESLKQIIDAVIAFADADTAPIAGPTPRQESNLAPLRRPEAEPAAEETPGPLPNTELHAARRTGDEELLPETWELVKQAQKEVRRKHGGPNRRGTPPEGEEK